MTLTTGLLTVRDLTVRYRTRAGWSTAVENISFSVASGETVAVVGESGSGKSTTALAVTGLLPSNAVLAGGSIRLDGEELVGLGRRERQRVLGRRIGLIPQDPSVSLNPVRTVGDQVAEVLLIHRLAGPRAAAAQTITALSAAGIDQPDLRARQYPHELSGGMRQRVLIAIATVSGPGLIIADEPTSALDVTVQQQILDNIAGRIREAGAGVLLVTHDLGVAADRADRILVMTGGRIVETGTPAQVLGNPGHSYTRALIEAAPSLRPAVTLDGTSGSTATPGVRPLLELQAVSKDFQGGRRTAPLRAVDGVDLHLAPGRTLGLVGESGSGKSTTARIALRLLEPSRGRVIFDGQDITQLGPGQVRQLRRRIQLVQQNPYASLNPRLSVEALIAEPLRSFGTRRGPARRRATELLDQVALPASYLERRPAELSGGQRQRVAIARALAVGPDLVVLDEPVSALDVRVQAQILDLLVELQHELGVGYLFISHDLAVVRQISHEVAVMRHGRVVETGPVGQIFDSPQDEYTRTLLAAIPGRAVR